MYFLNYTLNALEIFREFKAVVERQSGKKIRLSGQTMGDNIYIICRKLTYSKESKLIWRENRTTVKIAKNMLKGKNL